MARAPGWYVPAGAKSLSKHYGLQPRGNPVGRAAGMSLIELVIAVAVVAILAAIALPAYTDYIARSQRVDARASLFELAMTLERCYTDHGRFNGGGCALLTFPLASPDGHYQLTAVIDTDSFDLQAIPVGRQAARDQARCALFRLEDNGRKSAQGTQADRCWQ